MISHIEETNAKDEALFYTFAQDVRDGSVFHILEGWTDKEDLDRYNVSPEFQETLKEVASKVRLLRPRCRRLHDRFAGVLFQTKPSRSCHVAKPESDQSTFCIFAAQSRRTANHLDPVVRDHCTRVPSM